MADSYPPSVIESLRRALEAVVPPGVGQVAVSNDTFGDTVIDLGAGTP